jgi:hypothetical protein
MSNVKINGFKAIDENGNYDYLHFLTAQDYPIKSINEIDIFFIENCGKTFLSYFSLPYDNWSLGGMDRIQNYHLGKRNNQNEFHRKSLSILNRFVQKTGLFKRNHPNGIKPYGGEGVMNLHNFAVKYILEFLKHNPRFLNFHKYSFAPDEMVFQTILLNSRDESLRKSIVNNVLWHIDWTKPDAKNYPVIFGVEDFEDLENSNKLFARKFDITYDTHVLDMIDKKLLHKE